MFYYYISIWTPIGYSGLYYRGNLHPLHPKAMCSQQKDIATKYSLRSGERIPPEAVTYICLHELPMDVAKELFPKDFEELAA
jgi:hypothetical protein